jgi:NO-binding membrane sensor protein with MHYT domain
MAGLVLLIIAAVIFGVVALICAVMLGDDRRGDGSNAHSIMVLCSILALFFAAFSGAEFNRDSWHTALLNQCPKKRVASERDFTCTVPVKIVVKDGEFGSVIYGDQATGEEK